ncbi:MAG: hypothetical protein RLZZ298_2147 [Pseudomonadota bacterium]|jgi:AAA15 family ATPase/GTPase
MCIYVIANSELCVITNIKIENYKSIDKLEIPLGRVNVLIGENGAGKSNILESIALAGAAVGAKLDNEFLASRGIRVTRPEYMRPAFPGFKPDDSISISIEASSGNSVAFKLTNDNEPYSKWTSLYSGKTIEPLGFEEFVSSAKAFSSENNNDGKETLEELFRNIANQISKSFEASGPIKKLKTKKGEQILPLSFKLEDDNPFAQFLVKRQTLHNEPGKDLQDFIVYSPENSSLRSFQKEGQIEPLGINGEGLLRLMSVFQSDGKYTEVFREIRRLLCVLGWFEDLEIVDDNNQLASRIEIKDRYLDESRRYFDQMSTNEGFLFLSFYFSLFSSDLTPKFFAVDNIDASLNPKLCSLLMKELIKLAIKHDKQVVLTTHNPAILDGLNLDDDEQRLFVISRNRQGFTRLKRVKKSLNDGAPIRLSEAFLRGSLGGLPKGF